MADFDSKLPVRTESNGDFVAKIGDGTTPSQQLAVDASGKVGVKLSDGAGTALTSTLNGADQSLDVNVTNAGGLEVQTDQLPTTLGQQVMADSLSVTIASDQSDLPVEITQPLPAGTNLIGEVDSNLHDGAGTAITSQASGAQQALDVGINVAGVQVDPRDVRALTAADEVTARVVDSAGDPFTPSNPLPVTMSDSPGDEINDYDTAAAVAGGATDNHDYAVSASTELYLTQIMASASGKLKIELQIETGVSTDTWVTKAVQFNSTANPNLEILLREPIVVAAGVRVRVIRTNKEASATDVYSTICGHEIAV